MPFESLITVWRGHEEVKQCCKIYGGQKDSGHKRARPSAWYLWHASTQIGLPRAAQLFIARPTSRRAQSPKIRMEADALSEFVCGVPPGERLTAFPLTANLTVFSPSRAKFAPPER